MKPSAIISARLALILLWLLSGLPGSWAQFSNQSHYYKNPTFNQDNVTSIYLYPPRNFQGAGIQEYAYLTWEKPIMFFASSDAIWDIIFYFNAHSANEFGIETNGEFIFTSKWNGPGQFSKYQQISGSWQWVEDFTVAGAGAIRDMAYNDPYFYGGAATTTIYKLDLVNKILVGTIPTSINVRHISYKPDLPGFYCGDWGTMALISMNGGVVTNITGLGLSSMTGSAYDNVSPGGPYLWIFDQGGNGVDIKQMKCVTNTLSNVSHSATDIPGFNAGISGGLCADNGNLVLGKFILMGSILQSPSLIFAYDICNTTGGGQTPPGLLGYNLYYHQDSIPFDYLNDPDSLDYYDGPLQWNVPYEYDITAMYDLTPYGQPGQTGESSRVGPVIVEIIFPFCFPFFEPWTSANFTYNTWTFSPDQGNWRITTVDGNPAPTAEFTGSPELTNYFYALESMPIPGNLWVCGHFYLDFDYKLYDSNINPTQTEKLKVEVFLNNQWQLEKTITNDGTTDWISEHLDISYVAGENFIIRFVAEGENSSNIDSWMVDNIKIYFECNPPLNLDYSITQPEIFFIWEPPVCSGSNWEILGYNVYRSVNFGQYEMINHTPIPTCSFADTLPANYWSLLYYTTAWFSDVLTGSFLCESIPSNIIDLSTTTPEHEGNSNVDIFPNPAGDLLTVRSSEKINIIGIFNNIGMLEMQTGGQGLLKAVLDISTLSQGIYFIRVQSGEREVVRKFVVMRQ
ncbi:MAG: T9SS type A sorting domain-containing protein [Bacteroidetes bacterium]|nr:T9SS type A sorting domain-containing protein [Bacteroidota bacterium]